jgi:hypothetical protein
MTQADILASLPAALHKHVDPAGPMPPRVMAAKGLAPLPPKDMVPVLCGLSLDADAALAAAASATLQRLPDKILQPALDTDLPPPVLGVLATALVGREDLLEKVVTNRKTPDAALAALAPTAPAKIAEILAENQERCLRSEALVRAIRQNTALLRSSLDRLFDFLVRAGVVYDDMPEFAESLARLSPTEIQAAAENVVLPDAVAVLMQEAGGVAAPAAASGIAELEGIEVLPLDAAEAGAPGAEEEEEEGPAKRIPMLKLINSLNAAQKVALALKGNKEARSQLIRESNRVIAVAALKNPRITEQEIQAAAKSRSVNDEVIRIISNSRDMTRSYGVKLALVNNPKTPLSVAMRFLGILRAVDLKAVANSKGLPSVLVLQAKKMLQSKPG